ncbi:TraR/DksA family transcriptional regulator [Desulfoluna butyratoxydans]|uniref:Zinc finger dksa/trar c4-type n=1 Tax=Desulfoluna butyratoxydans TaxID=231438 RepID=A0A4U8YKY5_9BACT|nr:TraR/DksA C4-type zinc finger protein [Desulfoluna butyratoxydans]VFQ43799.1 zinc finger dksa/trar c4-type [Desulfoluna butyratoxydans]
MTPRQRRELKTHMENELTQLKEELAATEAHTKPAVTPDSAIGRISRVEAMQSRHIGEASARARKTRIARLEHALDHVDDEDYGLCIACEEPIPLARLRLIPEATHCVACAADMER